MLEISTTDHHPAGRRSRHLGRSHSGLGGVSMSFHKSEDDVRALLALVAAAGSFTPLVSAATLAVATLACRESV